MIRRHRTAPLQPQPMLTAERPPLAWESTAGNAALQPGSQPGVTTPTLDGAGLQATAAPGTSPGWAADLDDDLLGGTGGSESVIAPKNGNNRELRRQERWGNENVDAWEQQLGQASVAPELPQPIKTAVGTVDYYEQRARDFERRNPGVPAPDYYRGYGKKYCRIFSEELYPRLSDAGQRWCVTTRMNLQLAIERRLLADPAGFAAMEQDPDALRAFAFGTHPIAYLEAGLADLPATDLAQIAMTPDLKDLLSADGLAQIFITAPSVAGEWLVDAVNTEDVDLVVR